MLKVTKNGKKLTYFPDGTLLREDYYIIPGPNQDTSECEGRQLSKYARITSVTWNRLGMVTLIDDKCPKCPLSLYSLLNFIYMSSNISFLF